MVFKDGLEECSEVLGLIFNKYKDQEIPEFNSLIVASRGLQNNQHVNDNVFVSSQDNPLLVLDKLSNFINVNPDIPISHCGEDINNLSLNDLCIRLGTTALRLNYHLDDRGEEIGMISFIEDPKSLLIITENDYPFQVFRVGLLDQDSSSEIKNSLPLVFCQSDLYSFNKAINKNTQNIHRLWNKITLGGRLEIKDKETDNPNLLYKNDPNLIDASRLISAINSGDLRYVKGLNGTEKTFLIKFLDTYLKDKLSK